jgi:hypothetical protein
MKPIVLPGFDDDRIKIPFTIPVKGRKPVTVMVPRFDYIDEDTFDLIMADLEQLDVEQQIIAIANELAELPVGTDIKWEPVLENTKTRLTDLGVKFSRTMVQGVSQDLISAPTDAVVKALEPFSSQTPSPIRKRSRSIALAMLKHVVSDQELQWFTDLPSGALDELLTAWKSASTVSLGESEASS